MTVINIFKKIPTLLICFQVMLDVHLGVKIHERDKQYYGTQVLKPNAIHWTPGHQYTGNRDGFSGLESSLA